MEFLFWEVLWSRFITFIQCGMCRRVIGHYRNLFGIKLLQFHEIAKQRGLVRPRWLGLRCLGKVNVTKVLGAIVDKCKHYEANLISTEWPWKEGNSYEEVSPFRKDLQQGLRCHQEFVHVRNGIVKVVYRLEQISNGLIFICFLTIFVFISIHYHSQLLTLMIGSWNLYFWWENLLKWD